MNDNNVTGIYNSEYFKWQKEIGEFGGKANLFKFKKYISENANVLDFGCGGGYLLSNIDTTGRKIGIEINATARNEAINNGIECYSSLSEVPDNSIDVVISNHALEHVLNPVEVLNEFKRVLKDGGILVVVVPIENSRAVNVQDHNMHLYTWTAQNLVNLFRVCGIKILEYKTICHTWMPYYRQVQCILGWRIFHLLCKIRCKVKRTGYQTLVAGYVEKL